MQQTEFSIEAELFQTRYMVDCSVLKMFCFVYFILYEFLNYWLSDFCLLTIGLVCLCLFGFWALSFFFKLSY